MGSSDWVRKRSAICDVSLQKACPMKFLLWSRTVTIEPPAVSSAATTALRDILSGPPRVRVAPRLFTSPVARNRPNLSQAGYQSRRRKASHDIHEVHET